MADKLDNSAPFDDEQGTRIGGQEPTGAGSEASEGIRDKPEDSKSHEHRSGYGGKGGKPVESNDGQEKR